MGFDDHWLTRTLTQISTHWYPWQTWLIYMHCSQKAFHFLSVSNRPTSILSDIVITLRKSHQIILWVIFEKPKILARDVFERSQRRREKDICFEMCLRRLKDDTKKTSFLRCYWDILKTSQKSYLFWDVSKRSMRCFSQWRSNWDLSETSYADLDAYCNCLLIRFWFHKFWI